MPVVSIVLAVASLFVLAAGLWAWRLTSSRPLMINVFVSSIFLLLSGYAAAGHEHTEFGFILSFFATMTIAGRAVGLIVRSYKESFLRVPGWLLGAVSLFCGLATIAAYRYTMS